MPKSLPGKKLLMGRAGAYTSFTLNQLDKMAATGRLLLKSLPDPFDAGASAAGIRQWAEPYRHRNMGDAGDKGKEPFSG
jgi:hypothetical protein